MGQSTEELTEQIDQTRDRLGSDLDALQDKVSPKAIMNRRTTAARDRARGVKDKVMGSAQRASDAASSTSGSVTDAVPSPGQAADGARHQVEGSPLTAGLVAFGAGLLIAALLPGSDAEAKAGAAVVDAVQDKAQPLVEDLKSAGADVGQSVKETATDAASQVKDTASDSAGTVKDEGASAAQTVREESPTPS